MKHQNKNNFLKQTVNGFQQRAIENSKVSLYKVREKREKGTESEASLYKEREDIEERENDRK